MVLSAALLKPKQQGVYPNYAHIRLVQAESNSFFLNYGRHYVFNFWLNAFMNYWCLQENYVD